MSIDFQLALRQYLLGRLEPETAERLERQLVTDQDLFERLEIEETELLDDYVADTLDAEDRKAFDVRLDISSRLRQRLAAAQGLRVAIDHRLVHSEPVAAPNEPRLAHPSPRTSAQTTQIRRVASIALLCKLAAAAIAVAALISVWLWWANPSGDQTLPQTRQFVENNAPQDLPDQQSADDRPGSSTESLRGGDPDEQSVTAPDFIQATLFPAVRSGEGDGPTTITVPPGQAAELLLIVELGSATNYDTLSATLERDGEPVRELVDEITVVDPSRIEIRVAPALVVPGIYYLKLASRVRGSTASPRTLNFYEFSIRERPASDTAQR